MLCWGDDSEDQLGPVDPNADGDAGSYPVKVVDEAMQVSAGGAHSCALTQTGAVLCWGRDAEGQVDGTARSDTVATPSAVAIAPASDIAAGAAHTCAVVARGVVCWGDARYGQVGREVKDAVLAPSLVPGTEGAVQVTAGVRHTCARFEGGRVACWGELIDEAGRARAGAEVVAVAGLEDATEIEAGAGHTCAVRAGGQVVCWGDNSTGQLGDGTTRASATPVTVARLPLALHVSAGGLELDGQLVGHTCALDTAFFVQCWGRNAEGQLDVGPAPDSAYPLVAKGLPDESDEPYLGDVIAISEGGLHGCALDDNGFVSCWGDDSAGQLGSNDTPPFGRAVVTDRFGRRRR